MAVNTTFGVNAGRADPEAAEVEHTRRRLVVDLTPFEKNTMNLFASGLHRREIADRLRRSPKTISNSLTVAKEKLGARSLAEAAALIARYVSIKH
ncbi:MAG TPA: helix-turn-helix transcriptional regulator [Candidatus Dormibacteraeota bacterium]|nr:helix-turn-helix transcriptional regulator [Candidatus Dormibacteraeota bacterium]